ALFDPTGGNPAFLISEAVRGFGGVLKTNDGQTFMEKYDNRESLAPRDIVARAIDREMKLRGEEHVLLDCTHLDRDSFVQHFPNIYKVCQGLGIDPIKDMIPVQPACHYLCGGVVADLHGRTSITRLYAVGECSFSGLHGANRLASNSLLEAVVFAHRAAEDILQKIDEYQWQSGLPEWDVRGTNEPEEMVLITQSTKELKEIMSSYVGIVRSPERLKRALDRLYLLYVETENIYRETVISPQLCELRNLITIGYLISRSAQLRKESRGLHFNIDYADKLEKTQNTYL
nr:FAD-binding protein [Saprospiraceae bacterium]